MGKIKYPFLILAGLSAIVALILVLTGSGLAMGVVGVLSTLPDLIVGLPAGAYADRWDRRRMMLLADLGRAVLTALIPISVWLGGPTLALIFLVTFPLNVLRVLWLAAFTAAVPGLVGRGQIARANAIFEAFFNVGWIVGPADLVHESWSQHDSVTICPNKLSDAVAVVSGAE